MKTTTTADFRAEIGIPATCLCLLDTNVLIHDPMAIFRFQEHDVFVPRIVIEELDRNKTGVSDVARNSRSASRYLEKAIKDGLRRAGGKFDERHSVPLIAPYNRLKPIGRIFLQNWEAEAITGIDGAKNDNKILAVAAGAAKKFSDRHVVVVSKDTNLRLMALSSDIPVQDYRSDTVLSDTDVMPRGHRQLRKDFFLKTETVGSGATPDGRTWIRVRGGPAGKLTVAEYVYLEPEREHPFYGRVVEKKGNEAVIRSLYYHPGSRASVFHATPKNREQWFFLDALMDPDVHFVSAAGIAGTGKTYLAIAAGLAQKRGTEGAQRFNEIIFMREIMPMGREMGDLPGTEKEKLDPWLRGLYDNLRAIARQIEGAENEGKDAGPQNKTRGRHAHLTHGEKSTSEDIIEHLEGEFSVNALTYMRGASLEYVWLIIDEAQNLTPKQLKSLISRAGQGTKIVMLGNTEQIDTPFLTEQSCGLTFVVQRFAGHALTAHVYLPEGVRSPLANLANEVL